MIETYPTAWLERCLDVMAMDPETASESIGLPCGLHRPELGPAVQDLQCVNCEATWAGIVGEPCEWCEAGLRRQMQYQIDLLLAAPDVDPEDVRCEGQMEAWTRRLINGVKTELITQAQADSAWKSAVRRAVA